MLADLYSRALEIIAHPLDEAGLVPNREGGLEDVAALVASGLAELLCSCDSERLVSVSLDPEEHENECRYLDVVSELEDGAARARKREKRAKKAAKKTRAA